MRIGMFSAGMSVAAIVAISAVAFSGRAAAQQEKILHSFINKGIDGLYPNGPLVFDSAGNLYGTTESNEQNFYGTVFELLPSPGGTWRERILHTFNNDGTDGIYPYGGLVFDSAGNLYGTTMGGGPNSCGVNGCGIVFELTPQPGGAWKETILHNFIADGTDGYYPGESLTLDAAGNLYGALYEGGTFGDGVVFELTHATGGVWSEKILHNFSSNGVDGTLPAGILIFDSAGNLYGVVARGGAYGYGAVFEMKALGSGRWTERMLYSFTGSGDGNYPTAGLTLDAMGNLYGTTSAGGEFICPDGNEGCGTVFELTPTAGGGWAEKILHSFSDDGIDGYYPRCTLTFDASGNLYGLTTAGGPVSRSLYGGTAFELKPTAGGGWAERILHDFTENGVDGAYPQSGLILDSFGNLYGAAPYGGPGGYGVVFEIKH